MQVKVCPKCNTENKPDRASCSNCYSSLAQVNLSLSKKLRTPVVVKSRTAATRTNQPTAPPAANSPYSAPSPGVGRRYQAPQPVAPVPKSSSNWFLVTFLIVVLLAGCALVTYVLMGRTADTPQSAIINLSEAWVSGDYDRAKVYMTRASVDHLQKALGSEEKVAEFIKKQSNPLAIPDISIGDDTSMFKEPVFETEDRAYVEIKLPDDATARTLRELFGAEIKLGMVCLREEGKWKVDLPQTEQRLMAQMDETMKKLFGENAPGNSSFVGGTPPQPTVPSPPMPPAPAPTPPAPALPAPVIPSPG